MTKDIEHYEHTLMTGIHRHNMKQFTSAGKILMEIGSKLNCDGSYKDSMNIAGCGGLFRDLDCRWLKGYTQRIEDCDALHAEMKVCKLNGKHSYLG
ncbi:receptor-like kinase [Trifolium pratense]|uniref:Receptor-like kinase n=1 Tax=Trifolium pratense TaxID=57577 RepID=A0A2K3LD54_TRIPR|nr:receptor-like kinase [Trifolium pratense]